MTSIGAPYQGSKNTIAFKIVDKLPAAHTFYDCFGGGGAITIAALRSKKYDKVIYNEYDPLIYNGVRDAFLGNLPEIPKFISKQDFIKLKDKEFWVCACFSWQSAAKQYGYGKTEKKAKETFNNYYANGCKGEKIEAIQRYDRLKRMSKEDTTKLEFSNCSYEQLKFKPNSVIYCDPPYRDSAKYRSAKQEGIEVETEANFDSEAYDNWVLGLKNVYMSEYYMPDDKFVSILSIPKVGNQTKNRRTVYEQLYIPRKVYKDYKPCGQLTLFDDNYIDTNLAGSRIFNK